MDNKNWISSYNPISLNLRYIADSFQDKQKDLKLKEKLFAASILDSDLFKLKRDPCITYFDIITDNCDDICNRCFKHEKSNNLSNCVNLLDIKQLFSFRNSRIPCFKYSKLFLTRSRCSINSNSKLLQNKELLDFLYKFAVYHEKKGTKNFNKPVTYETLFEWMKKAVKNFGYTFSSLTFKIIGICWYLVSFYFIQKLIVSSEQIKNIKKADISSHFPLVYVVKNRSKIDCLIILFVLFFCQLKIPVIFLRKDVKSRFNWIYRKFGVVFIPSSNESRLKFNVFLETWLHYIEENLKNGNRLLFYLENKQDDAYILETLIDSIKRNAVVDVLLSSVNVNYEKEVDKFLTNDLSDYLFRSTLNNIRKKKYNYGYVNVTFHHPVSLKEFMLSLGNDIDLSIISSKIINHLNFELCRLQILTSTNLICFILLKKFRNGTNFDNFVRKVEEFRSELKSLKKRVGFTGSTANVVNHVVKLHPKLITVDLNIIKPVTQLPHVLEIAHYANDTLSHFMLDCIIMTSVSALLKSDLEECLKGRDKELKFDYIELIENSERLCEILQFESAFEKPCQTVTIEMKEVLFKFISNNYFSKIEKMMIAEEEWGHRFAKHLEDTESDESENDEYYSPNYRRSVKNLGDLYVVNNRTPVLKEILFYKNSLKPILDAYVVNAQNLKTLIGKQIADFSYYKQLQDKMQTMLEERQLQYSESISLDNLKNSMKLFEKWGVIESYTIDGIQLFYLSKNFDSENDLSFVAEKIKMFQ